MELIIHWQELPDEDVTYLCLLCSEWNANLDAAIYNINIQKFDDEAKDDARHNSSIMYTIIYSSARLLIAVFDWQKLCK